MKRRVFERIWSVIELAAAAPCSPNQIHLLAMKRSISLIAARSATQMAIKWCWTGDADLLSNSWIWYIRLALEIDAAPQSYSAVE